MVFDRIEREQDGQERYEFVWTPTAEELSTPATFAAFVDPFLPAIWDLEITADSRQEVVQCDETLPECLLLNGEIVFGCIDADRISSDICVIAPDGSGLRKVAYNAGQYQAEWSPDHSLISVQGGGCKVFDALGTEQSIGSINLGCRWSQRWFFDSSTLHLEDGLVSGQWLVPLGYDWELGFAPDALGVVALSPASNLALSHGSDGLYVGPALPPDAARQMLVEGVSWGRWSENGSKISYVSDGQLFVINPDGSGGTRITGAVFGNGQFTARLSPQGDRIAVVEYEESHFGVTHGRHLEMISVDDPTQREIIIEPLDGMVGSFEWSADGEFLVYSLLTAPDINGVRSESLRLVRADGTGDRTLTGGTGLLRAFLPDW